MKLLKIIFLFIINLLLSICGLALYAFLVNPIIDSLFHSLVMLWLAGIGIFFLLIYANVILFKKCYYKILKKAAYISICSAEYAGIITVLLYFISILADV